MVEAAACLDAKASTTATTRTNARQTCANRRAVCAPTPSSRMEAHARLVQGCAEGLCREPHIAFTGDQEDVIGAGQWGLHCIPDEHVSYYKTDDTFHLWSPRGMRTISLRGLQELTPAMMLNGNSVPAFDAQRRGFRPRLRGPGSVIRAINGQDLLMFYHGEYQWPEGGYYATIGLARSSDEGQTLGATWPGDHRPASKTRSSAVVGCIRGGGAVRVGQ